MGITARGAWEAVKRHFREMDRNIQEESFTVAGVGDMSGDVFGNGMLLSPCTRLVAAFDHRDIFIDPDPDPKSSFEERKRLFDKGQSSWQDYDRDKLSKGGASSRGRRNRSPFRRRQPTRSVFPRRALPRSRC
jgi:glutamate dehydrogenase